jgi:hypothetical protein
MIFIVKRPILCCDHDLKNKKTEPVSAIFMGPFRRVNLIWNI